jgi:hypothetical protein
MKTSESGSPKAPLHQETLACSASIAKPSLDTSKPSKRLEIQRTLLIQILPTPYPAKPKRPTRSTANRPILTSQKMIEENRKIFQNSPNKVSRSTYIIERPKFDSKFQTSRSKNKLQNPR